MTLKVEALRAWGSLTRDRSSKDSDPRWCDCRAGTETQASLTPWPAFLSPELLAPGSLEGACGGWRVGGRRSQMPAQSSEFSRRV